MYRPAIIIEGPEPWYLRDVVDSHKAADATNKRISSVEMLPSDIHINHGIPDLAATVHRLQLGLHEQL